MPSRPIGIFDSGVGGLSVLKELLKILPDENYLYFGDTARVPYGEKSKEELLQFSREILDWFKSQNVKMVLMACNTSSALTLNEVKKDYNFPILGLIEPTAEYISQLGVKKIGLMATTATVKSGSYPKAIKSHGIEILDIACPGLVEIVEKADISAPEAKESVLKYLQPLQKNNVEKIIFGCTHYPFLKEVMCELGCCENMFIDPASCISQQAKKQLNKLNLLKKGKGLVKYYASSNPKEFAQNSKLFFKGCNDVELLEFNKTTQD